MLIHATLVAATRGKALKRGPAGGMCLSCLQSPLLCRDSGGEMHTCVSMMAWPISQVLALVLFVPAVNRYWYKRAPEAAVFTDLLFATNLAHYNAFFNMGREVVEACPKTNEERKALHDRGLTFSLAVQKK